MTADGMNRMTVAAPLMPRSISPLDDRVEPLQRDVVNVDDGDAVEIFEARAQREELHQVRHDLDVDHFTAGVFDQVEHLHVLVERQGDIQVIDAFLADDLCGVGQRTEQRQAPVAEIVAACPIVDETDDLIAQLAVLKDSFGDDSTEIASSGYQDALEADARFPAALQHFANELARAEGEYDVEDEEQRPDDSRDLIRADVLKLRGRVVGLESTAC